MRIALIRPPFTYRYNSLDVREDPLLTYLQMALYRTGFRDVRIFDYHLARATHVEDILRVNAQVYVIAVRDSGNNIHYALRLTRFLAQETPARIILYGQTARLRYLPDLPPAASTCLHDEGMLLHLLGEVYGGPRFETGLQALPYLFALDLPDWQRRRAKAAIETTRGCPFPCRFCFINTAPNHPKRWQVRPTDAILADIETYRHCGVRQLVFSDAEFLGASSAVYPEKRRLLHAIRDTYPGTRYKIFSRADTLLQFDSFDLLKASGLSAVFMGVESLDQRDLDALQKRLTVPDILECIRRLAAHEIPMELSFITFNRNTTVATLETNLNALEQLVTTHGKYVGLPYFLFTFETAWKARGGRRLSGRTYVTWDLAMSLQPHEEVLFNPDLEPLMEIYRLLAYEWARKATTLNLAQDTASQDETCAIKAWFYNLSAFCLQVMRAFLEQYKAKRLTFDALNEAKHALMERVQRYHAILPSHLRDLETWSAHTGQIDYTSESVRLEDDEYWSGAIPR